MGPYFNSRDKHYKDPFGAVPCGAEVRFALADDTYYGCELLVLREFAGTEDTCALPPAEGGFAGTYTAPAGGELCWYCFRLTVAACGTAKMACRTRRRRRHAGS